MKTDVLETMRKLLSIDPYKAPISEVRNQIKSFGLKKRKRLLFLMGAALNKPSNRKDEQRRVPFAKIIIALLPISAQFIKRLISRASGKYDYEIHFSLFCFMDTVRSMDDSKRFASEIPGILANYLLNTKSNAARSAWMAGHLLGEHWIRKESLPVLLRVVKFGRFLAGRKAALQGLAQTMHNASASDEKRIVRVLGDVSGSDRSIVVRHSALSILQKYKRQA